MLGDSVSAIDFPATSSRFSDVTAFAAPPPCFTNSSEGVVGVVSAYAITSPFAPFAIDHDPTLPRSPGAGATTVGTPPAIGIRYRRTFPRSCTVKYTRSPAGDHCG